MIRTIYSHRHTCIPNVHTIHTYAQAQGMYVCWYVRMYCSLVFLTTLTLSTSLVGEDYTCSVV